VADNIKMPAFSEGRLRRQECVRLATAVTPQP